MTELIILDVAHGNSSLLVSNNQVAIFDAAPKDVLLDTLNLYAITEIDYLYLSHLDKDHVGGVGNILSSRKISIKNIIINPDSTKPGPQNRRLRVLINDAAIRNGINVLPAHVASGTVTIGEVSVNVLSPSLADYLSGPGGTDSVGKVIDSNSASVVLKLTHENHPIVLFGADMDQRNLNSIVSGGQNMQSDILVFPHHGGNCAESDAANASFAAQLANLVQPRVTIFSMGRTAFANPRPEIIAAVRQTVPNTYISCTQLSSHCLANLPQNRTNWTNHLSGIPGSGHAFDISCGGTLHLRLKGSSTSYPDRNGLHAKFIQLNIPNSLC